MKKTSFTRILIAAALALVVVGCGGGGGSNDAVVAGDVGNVAILLTDAPTDIYEEIHITITTITLLPADDESGLAPVALFEGEETIDLLQLQNHAELFEVAEGVPIGDYTRVRLAISLVQLVDTDTTPPTRREAMLPSDHIELVTRDALRVSDGNTLYLELDVDTEQSVLIVQTGTGELIFRPVVFVTAYEEGEREADDNDGAGDSPLLSVKGVLREIGEELAVCPSSQANERACVRLVFGEDSAIFDENGNPAGIEVLTAGTELVAMGLLASQLEGGRRVLDLLGLVLGTRPTVGVRGGEADSVVDTDGVFTLSNGRTVELDDTTPIVEEDGTIVDRNAIQPGQALTIFGFVQEDPVAAALVILREDDDEDGGVGDDDGSQITLRGELVSVDTADTLQVSVDGVAEPVRLVEGGELIISGPDTVEEGSLADLAGLPRVRIVARGTRGESYFEATLIVAIILDEDDDVVGDDVDG